MGGLSSGAVPVLQSQTDTEALAPEVNLPKVTRSARGEPRWTVTCVTSASTLSCSDKSDGGAGCFRKTLIVKVEARGRDSVQGDLQSESQSWGSSGIMFPYPLT